MAKPQAIIQIPATQNVRDWFVWASELVTGITNQAEWTPTDRHNMNKVLAATAYSLVDDRGRRELINSRNPIGKTLQKRGSDLIRLDNQDAVPVLQDMADYLLDKLAEQDPRAAFNAAAEILGAIPTNGPATEFLRARLSLLRLQIGEELSLPSGVAAKQKDAVTQRVNAGDPLPTTPQGRLAHSLYIGLTSGVLVRALEAA
jgi:hypothetical protein